MNCSRDRSSKGLGKLIGFSLGLLPFALLACVAVPVYWVIDGTQDMRIRRATQKAPIEIASHGLTPTALANLEARVDDYLKAASDGNRTALRLTPDELTALVEPFLPAGGGSRIRFETESGTLYVRGSIDLKDFGHPGRYLNGCLAVVMEERAGHFFFNLYDLKGHEDAWISRKVLRALEFHAIGQYAYACPVLSDILDESEQISVDGGVIAFKPKSRAKE
ncbi:MAG: hypothetical protein ACR2NU_11300 [Aeoliella sp.]